MASIKLSVLAYLQFVFLEVSPQGTGMGPRTKIEYSENSLKIPKTRDTQYSLFCH